jgi:murein DD-endopeptidase MepM/ murein hydrolase activator NlpD
VWVRRTVEAWAAQTHRPRSLVDVDALAREAERRRTAGASAPEQAEWLRRELQRADHSFAPAGARHDDRARYGLPFDPRVPRVVSQGPGGEQSHTGRQREAFDFVMPVGTPVLAAREGRVGQVVDGFTAGGRDSRLPGNHVAVVHDDGSFALYVHLSPGIPVRVGQRVARGQLLARSGQTGNATAPHLHFAVACVDADGLQHATVPIRFGRPGGAGFVPQKNEFVGTAPTPNVALAVSVAGRPTAPSDAVAVRRGDRLALRVTLEGAARDLVGDSRLELVSMTPWNLSLERGTVAIEPMAGFPWDFVPGLSDVAVLGVYFTDAARGQIGLGQVQFRIRGPQPAP